ncbi:enoyl-CoA hydratase-related protein [Nocardia rhizosphaerihabitans]|uniref:enoyl-CoA hydratase-related protein n=1 Tax=Nocardia rhizosphaerihabitans TaxID=1691570 RepID=UPI00367168A8
MRQSTWQDQAPGTADELVHAFEQASRDDTIAAVVVTGAGRAFCAGMDLSVEGNVFGIAGSEARIGFVFGKLGIVPEACSTWFLPRIVGISRALELAYSAEILSADAAFEAGLVRTVVPAAELMETAYTLPRKFTTDRSPVATSLTWHMMYRNSAQPHPIDAHRVDSLAMSYTSIGDGKEGVDAFLGKSPPQFTGRISHQLPQVFG